MKVDRSIHVSTRKPTNKDIANSKSEQWNVTDTVSLESSAPKPEYDFFKIHGELVRKSKSKQVSNMHRMDALEMAKVSETSHPTDRVFLEKFLANCEKKPNFQETFLGEVFEAFETSQSRQVVRAETFLDSIERPGRYRRGDELLVLGLESIRDSQVSTESQKETCRAALARVNRTSKAIHRVNFLEKTFQKLRTE